MLKKKITIIALLVAIFLSFMVPTVNADNETGNQLTEEQNASSVSATNGITPEVTNTTSENTLKSGDVYLFGSDITIDYIVDGNVFVFATNSVTIRSQIGGDVFVLSPKVTVEETGYVYSNLFALGQELTISGVVYDLYTSAQNININGYIYRDIHVIANQLNISGTIGRNAFVQSSQISFATAEGEESQVTSQGRINGDFNYTSTQEISIPEGSVKGNVNYTNAKPTNTNTAQTYILSLVRFLANVIIVWLLCLWLAPKFLQSTSELISKKTLSIFGYGILTPIVGIFAFVLLLLLGISNIATLGIGVLFLAIAISSAIFVIAINQLICNKLKIEKNLGIFGMLVLSAAVLWGVALIPYLGSIVSLIVSILGFGIIIKGILPKKDSTNIANEKNTEKNKNKKTK